MATPKKQPATKKPKTTEGSQSTRPTTGRGGTGNFPQIINPKAEDVQRIGSNLMYWYGLKRISTDEECEERLVHFFERCFTNGELPTVEKMALSLGYDRRTLNDWENKTKQATSRKADIIKKAKELLASFDAEMVTEGKINPITYIFRAKNYFGMKDTQDIVLTPNNPMGDMVDLSDIKARHALAESVPMD